jgi:hypothetical protein
LATKKKFIESGEDERQGPQNRHVEVTDTEVKENQGEKAKSRPATPAIHEELTHRLAVHIMEIPLPTGASSNTRLKENTGPKSHVTGIRGKVRPAAPVLASRLIPPGANIACE